ncbi:MAG: hypoxanthine phosphoribosyltransferase [Deltaproteobacteria bacterium]|jgi:hypoxanthine phosphoribosyltransferase|nr:hypoxanthine phosphoribosyltransferase [Deltaproteobacteria bacterium]MDA8305316.1 hypoxanthine phosphoribosyltransferase [Deltaproteobacteria bacterium]
MAEYRLLERVSPERLNRCVEELAQRINHDYQGKSLVLVGVLKGAFIFMADLARRIDFPVKLDFVRLASYGDKAQTSGNVRLTKDIELSLQGSHVLIVEDIVDSGVTLKWLLDHFSNLGAESVKVCALVDKRERREVEITPEYVGLTVDSGFLVGYGLDFSENHRNLPGIYEVLFDKPLSASG